MSQKPSSVDLRVSDFKRVPGFNYVLSVLAEDERTYDSLCSDIREAWSINASNGLQIYAFPEGTKDESATFANTPKVFQSVMSVWRSMPNLARGSARSENSSGEQFGVASRAITPWIRDGSLIAAHNMLWVLWLLWARCYAPRAITP